MRLNVFRPALLAPVALLALTLTAAASPIKYDVTLNSTGGQIVQGYIVFDPNLGFNSSSVTDWSFNLDLTNEITTNGVAFGTHVNTIANGGYVLDKSDSIETAASYCCTALYFTGMNTNSSGSTIENQLSFAFNSYPGSLNTGYGAFFIQNWGPGVGGSTNYAGVNFDSGTSVVATPEPPTAILSASGMLLLLAGFGWYERRRLAVSA